jgi:phosphoglycerate dehydrogenase-like enzyme
VTFCRLVFRAFKGACKYTGSVPLLVDISHICSLHHLVSRGMIGKEQLAKMKRGAYLVNNARGPIVDRDAVVEANKSGQLRGYGGDVWYPQLPPGKGQTPVFKSALVSGNLGKSVRFHGI